MKALVSLFLIILLSSLLLAGCFPTQRTDQPKEPAGFLMGIWHGWIAPVSLIVGFFDNDVRVYESVNTGWWYDFGFYIAVIAGFGGLALSRRKKSEN